MDSKLADAGDNAHGNPESVVVAAQRPVSAAHRTRDQVVDELEATEMPEAVRRMYMVGHREERRANALPLDLIDRPALGLLKSVPARRG